MKTFFAVFIASFIIVFVLVPIWIGISRRRGWLDHPEGERKVHEAPTPTLGGVPVFFGLGLPLLILFFWPNQIGEIFRENYWNLLSLAFGCFLVLILGIYDDLKGASARLKFLAQIGVAVLVYYFGYKIQIVSIPFSERLELGVFALPLTVLWIVGITNAINLTDGIDGLASGICFFVLVTLFGVSLVYRQPLVSALSIAGAGSLLGFLRYNFYPARVFLGNSGSMVMGFFIACVSIQGSYKSAAVVALAVPVLALGVPIMDTLLAIGRRAWERRPIFSGDRDHIHHRLIQRGMTQSRAAFFLYGLTVFFGLLGFFYTLVKSAEAALILLTFAIVVVMLVQRLGYFSRSDNDTSPAQKR